MRFVTKQWKIVRKKPSCGGLESADAKVSCLKRSFIYLLLERSDKVLTNSVSLLSRAVVTENESTNSAQSDEYYSSKHSVSVTRSCAQAWSEVERNIILWLDMSKRITQQYSSLFWDAVGQKGSTQLPHLVAWCHLEVVYSIQILLTSKLLFCFFTALPRITSHLSDECKSMLGIYSDCLLLHWFSPSAMTRPNKVTYTASCIERTFIQCVRERLSCFRETLETTTHSCAPKKEEGKKRRRHHLFNYWTERSCFGYGFVVQEMASWNSIRGYPIKIKTKRECGGYVTERLWGII